MKIGLCTPGFSASESDPCIPILRDLVGRLARRHEVHVFTLRHPPGPATYGVFGARVRAIGGQGARGTARVSLLARSIGALAAEHHRAPFDAIQAIWGDEPGAVAALAGRLLGVPSVVHFFGGELVALEEIAYGGALSRLNRILTGLTLRLATRVTTGAQDLADRARQAWGRTVEVRPIGVEAARFTPSGTRADLHGSPRLLQVASLVPIKDTASLISALPPLVARWPRLQLHVLGDGPLRASLAALASRLGIDDHVTLHGSIPHERLADYYRSATLYVQSSRHECQSLAVLEAVACGLPVAGTRVGILADLVPDAALAPPAAPGALSDCLAALLADADALARVGEVARARVLPRLTLERTTADLEHLYGELVAREGRSGA